MRSGSNRPGDETVRRKRAGVGKTSQTVYRTPLDQHPGAGEPVSTGRDRRSAALKNSRRGGLSERAYDHLKEMLVTGTVTDREWFQIDDIATQLDMSRQPVMDALRRLSTEGFVEIVPQVGCRPRRPDVNEIRDFFRLFAEGEAIIAELAAERAEPNVLLTMRLISAQIGALADQPEEVGGRADMYRSLNRQLHSEMRRAAHSASVAEIVESLGDRSDFYIACFKDRVFAPNLKIAHAEHEEIIEAIIARNPRKARSAMKKHISATEKRLEDSFRESPSGT
ncbi:GntR family transcriptional regulator (plasmid) [Sphingomonas paeninsulae]|uniref:GntR family transcriptional regulator n=1 Tax=Sphingomonas paeninsulae TaxID=2319844 RepID=A0A494TH64_SPHPE|nr:GntR family transcriptional regulator [Sphingomonas paeninsulae]